MSYCRSVSRFSPLTIPFDVTDFTAGGISYLEHVVVKITLEIRGYSRGYDTNDFLNEVNFDPEGIYIWLEDPHTRRGDIQIELTSPDSTTSVLLPYRNYDFINEEGYDNWPFMSVHHWGENPVGRWTLKISFKSYSGYVSVSGVEMTLYGTTTTPQSVNNIPNQCDAACTSGCSGEGANNCDACKHYRIAETLECVDQCPTNTTHIYKKYCLKDGPPTSEPDSKTDEPPTSEPDSVNLAAVVGGAAGGIFLMALGVIIPIVVVAMLRRRNRSPSGQGFIPLPRTGSPNHTDV